MSENSFEGKIINCLGDSITAGAGNDGHGWSSMIGPVLKAKLVRNYGINGTTIADWEGGTRSFWSRYNQMEKDADLIIVSGGVNDFNHGIEIGKADSRNPHEFFGSLNDMIPGLLSACPSADLVFITPMKTFGFKNYPHWNTENSAGYKLIDYRNAIMTACDYYSIPVLDLYTEAAMSPDIPEVKELLLCDGLHPNAKGYERMTRKIANFLMYRL